MNSSINRLFKYLFLGWFGGSTYATTEVLYRGYSHWTMVILGSIVFILLGGLNKFIPWSLGFIQQVLIGTFIVTLLEFATGCIVNIWLGWHVWDYSNMDFNICGQVCPQFILAWIPLVVIAIVSDDLIRWKFFGEEKPHYKLI